MAETLLFEEGMIPVYDIVTSMCEQVKGRLTDIKAHGAPSDMKNTFVTIFYVADRFADCGL